ncbi:hypothetical protein WA158_005419 [Blastocystis sp. Blastoise]
MNPNIVLTPSIPSVSICGLCISICISLNLYKELYSSFFNCYKQYDLNLFLSVLYEYICAKKVTLLSHDILSSLLPYVVQQNLISTLEPFLFSIYISPDCLPLLLQYRLYLLYLYLIYTQNIHDYTLFNGLLIDIFEDRLFYPHLNTYPNIFINNTNKNAEKAEQGNNNQTITNGDVWYSAFCPYYLPRNPLFQVVSSLLLFACYIYTTSNPYKTTLKTSFSSLPLNKLLISIRTSLTFLTTPFSQPISIIPANTVPLSIALYVSPAIIVSILYSTSCFLYVQNKQDLYISFINDYLLNIYTTSVFILPLKLSLNIDIYNYIYTYILGFFSNYINSYLPLTAPQSLAILGKMIKSPTNKEKTIRVLFDKYNVIMNKELIPSIDNESLFSLLLKEGYVSLYIDIYKKLYGTLDILSVYISYIHDYYENTLMNKENNRGEQDKQLDQIQQDMWSFIYDIMDRTEDADIYNNLKKVLSTYIYELFFINIHLGTYLLLYIYKGEIELILPFTHGNMDLFYNIMTIIYLSSYYDNSFISETTVLSLITTAKKTVSPANIETFIGLLCERHKQYVYKFLVDNPQYITPSLTGVIQKSNISEAYIYILYKQNNLDRALDLCLERMNQQTNSIYDLLKHIYIFKDLYPVVQAFNVYIPYQKLCLDMYLVLHSLSDPTISIYSPAQIWKQLVDLTVKMVITVNKTFNSKVEEYAEKCILVGIKQISRRLLENLTFIFEQIKPTINFSFVLEYIVSENNHENFEYLRVILDTLIAYITEDVTQRELYNRILSYDVYSLKQEEVSHRVNAPDEENILIYPCSHMYHRDCIPKEWNTNMCFNCNSNDIFSTILKPRVFIKENPISEEEQQTRDKSSIYRIRWRSFGFHLDQVNQEIGGSDLLERYENAIQLPSAIPRSIREYNPQVEQQTQNELYSPLTITIPRSSEHTSASINLVPQDTPVSVITDIPHYNSVTEDDEQWAFLSKYKPT